MKERMAVYRQLHQVNTNLVWKPFAVPLLRIATPFICNFKVDVSFEEALPLDGGLVFAQNHLNFFDSLVFDKAMKGKKYYCLAGDEPKGTIQGLSFEAKGTVWIARNSIDSRNAAKITLERLLEKGQNLSWVPEGTWNTTENRLMLPISRGMAQVAITSAQKAKVYIVPVVVDYQYKEGSHKVKRASVQVCKAVQVSAADTPEELTERLETIFWTTRWKQIEAQMALSPYRIQTENGYVYPRARLSREKWQHFVEKLHSQYKCDWSAEESYAIKTQVQKDHAEIARVLPWIRK